MRTSLYILSCCSSDDRLTAASSVRLVVIRLGSFYENKATRHARRLLLTIMNNDVRCDYYGPIKYCGYTACYCGVRIDRVEECCAYFAWMLTPFMKYWLNSDLAGASASSHLRRFSAVSEMGGGVCGMNWGVYGSYAFQISEMG
jgi:hypothetical protein